MQIVKPIDIEDALRIDLAEYVDARVFAPPAPDDLSAQCVQIMSAGGTQQTAVSHEYDVRIDCWGETEADAFDLANEVSGVVASLPFRSPSSGRHYVTAELNALPYLNPDPVRPLLPRCSFRAVVGLRGISIL